jgi:Fic-DOC domain mobile mystery protein B
VKTPSGATPFDVDGLRLTHLRTREAIYDAEAENILLAYQKYLRRRLSPNRAWFTEGFVRQVHRDMLGAVWEWGGRYRETELTIGVPAHQIREEIAKLCDDRLFWDKDKNMPIIERAARLHARLAWIHPFRNGNGRHARLITDIFLYSHRHALPEWPHSELIQEGTPREEYLVAMKQADRGNFESLITFTKRFLRTPPES